MDGWDDYLREQDEFRSAVRKQFKVSADRLQQIKRSSMCRRVAYPEMKEAFDYVHAIYPFVNIKQAQVYHASRALLYEVGYMGIGGFYDTAARVVVVTDHQPSSIIGELAIKSEYTLDEVLVHELIHYSANFKNASSSREVEEEIAYGKSVNYLRSKGRTDDFIINKNMMPYLISVVDRKPICHKVLTSRYSEKMLLSMSKEGINALLDQEQSAVMKGLLSAANALGRKMISIYGDKVEPGVTVTKSFRKLDLDNDD